MGDGHIKTGGVPDVRALHQRGDIVNAVNPPIERCVHLVFHNECAWQYLRCIYMLWGAEIDRRNDNKREMRAIQIRELLRNSIVVRWRIQSHNIQSSLTIKWIYRTKVPLAHIQEEKNHVNSPLILESTILPGSYSSSSGMSSLWCVNQFCFRFSSSSTDP